MEDMNRPLSVEVYEKSIGKLRWNFEELNRSLDLRLQRYKGLQYTEDQINEAKKDRANLNAFRKAMNDRKIELKKEFCAPYDEFAEQVKQLIAKIDEAAAGIDMQVKLFEQKEKDAKKAEIEKYWSEHGPKEIRIPFESVFDQKWLNKSCKTAQWSGALFEIADRIDEDMHAIAHLEDVEKMSFCVAEYPKHLDLGKTLAAYEAKVEADRRAAETRERMLRQRELMERERAEREARPKAEAEQSQVSEEQPELLTRAFKVEATREQIIALGGYMKNNGIKFWKIELEEN